MYNLIGCVTKRHTHSVNVVQFSTSGEYLASGDDAGLLLVYKVEDVDEYDKYHFEAAITSVAWVPGRPQIIVGLANCEVHIVYVGENKAFVFDYRPDDYDSLPTEWRVLYQVNAVALSSRNHLAIGVGDAIILLSKLDVDNQQYSMNRIICADPPAVRTGEAPKNLPFEVRSLHFADGDTNVVVAFLDAGVRCYSLADGKECWFLSPRTRRIARSALDSLSLTMVCANVQDGFDLYNVHTREHLRTFVKHAPEGANVSLPALFIHDDQDILLGSSGGPISIVKAADGTEVETLKDRGVDNADIVQAVAYVAPNPSYSYIATASSEKGPDTSVKIWRRGQFSFVQRSEDRPSNRHKDGSLARRDDRPLMHSINNQVSQDIVHDKPLTLRDYESARRDHNEPSVHRNKKTQAHRGDYSFSALPPPPPPRKAPHSKLQPYCEDEPQRTPSDCEDEPRRKTSDTTQPSSVRRKNRGRQQNFASSDAITPMHQDAQSVGEEDQDHPHPDILAKPEVTALHYFIVIASFGLLLAIFVPASKLSNLPASLRNQIPRPMIAWVKRLLRKIADGLDMLDDA